MTAAAPKRPPLFTEHFLSSRLPAAAGRIRADADTAYDTIKRILDDERASLDVSNEAQTDRPHATPGWRSANSASYASIHFQPSPPCAVP